MIIAVLDGNPCVATGFLSVLVCFLATVLGGAVGGGSIVRYNLQPDETTLEALPGIRRILTCLAAYATVAGILSFLIGGTVSLGHSRYLLNQFDRRPLSVRDLFSQFYQFGNGFCLHLLTTIYTTLWSLLFVIPGIVASYRYAMAPFILAEHPEYTAGEAIRASREMMRGYKLELFLLDLSFLGWIFLSFFTLGIGSLFLAPYRAAAYAAFYRTLSPASNIIDAQQVS